MKGKNNNNFFIWKENLSFSMFSDIHMQHKMQYLFVVVDIIMNALKEKFHGVSLSLNAGNTF